MQHHRGLDGQSVFVDVQAHHDKVALGHVRLSIIDLEGGAQPISNEHDNVHVVVNGELYDHKAIRQGLEERGHAFRTQSDSEVALHLYEEEGVSFTKHLRGEFAMLLWDARREVLVAVRDRFGIKPLFYASVRGIGVVLASEIKAFMAVPGWKAQWDIQSCSRTASRLTRGHAFQA